MALDVEGICRILKACHDSGVSEFSFEKLKVKFGPSQVTEEMVTPVAPHVAREFEAEAIAQAEMKIKEDQLANLPLEDPLRYEELIAEGDLSDARGKETEND